MRSWLLHCHEAPATPITVAIYLKRTGQLRLRHLELNGTTVDTLTNTPQPIHNADPALPLADFKTKDYIGRRGQTVAEKLTVYPVIPQKIEDLHIRRSLVTDLVMRHFYLEGLSSYDILRQTLKLAVPVIDTLIRQLRQQQLVEVRGMIGEDFSLALTSAGKAIAAERFKMVQYVGPAPVSIADYRAAIKAQVAHVNINRERLRQAFSDLVITSKTIDRLGPALVAQRSLFLYGPPGNGKTSIAERLLRIYEDAIVVPYAVEVDGQIVTLFDPVVHQRLQVNDHDLDPRWVICKRPCIIVGGELTMNLLELTVDSSSGIYTSPVQMKANNGILMIDDFGRQRVSPQELLNRWIVPLDRRVDYLSLPYGVKFEIPFEVMVVFSTNLDPNELADEAFLRRIENKVYLESVKPEIFDEIFRRVVNAKNIPADPDSSSHLRDICASRGKELRACFPNDFCKIISAGSEYENRPVRITREELEEAANLYFTT